MDTHGSVGNANEPEKPEEDEGSDLVAEGSWEAGDLKAALNAMETVEYGSQDWKVLHAGRAVRIN